MFFCEFCELFMNIYFGQNLYFWISLYYGYQIRGKYTISTDGRGIPEFLVEEWSKFWT